MTWAVDCPIFIDPSPDFSLFIEAYQLWIDMQPSYFLISDFEGSGGLPEELQSFRESELRQFAQSIRDAFSKHINLYLFIAALAEVSKVFFLFGEVLDSNRLVALHEPEVIVGAKGINLILLCESEAARDDDPSSFGQSPIDLAAVDLHSVLVLNPLPLRLLPFLWSLVAHRILNQ